MSAATRKLLLAEAVLLMAPATVLVTLGFVWSARFLAASVRCVRRRKGRTIRDES
jgi:hypothetical protein